MMTITYKLSTMCVSNNDDGDWQCIYLWIIYELRKLIKQPRYENGKSISWQKEKRKGKKKKKKEREKVFHVGFEPITINFASAHQYH